MDHSGFASRRWSLPLLLVLATGSALFGHGVVDQSFTNFNGSSAVFGGTGATQTFTPTKACLVGVDVYVVPAAASGTGTVAVNISTVNGPVIATSGNSAQMYHSGWFHIDIPPTAVTPGTQLKMAVENADQRFRWAYAPNGYAGGSAGNTAGTMTGNDWLFRTYGTDTCNQPPPQPGCTYALALAAASIHSSKYAWDTSLTTQQGCAWQVQSPVSWVQVYPATGTGPGTTRYTLFPNFSNATRAATVITNGRTLTVNQAGNTATADQRFVAMMYFNSFGRVPSQSEIDFHVGTLPSIGRPELVRRFLTSAEFNDAARWIAGLYVGLLDRDAEFTGWQFQRDALIQRIADPFGLVSNFLNSAEYKLKYGNPADADFVRLLYRNILLREPSQGEVDSQVSALQSGTPRAAMAYGFLTSQEFRNGTGPRLTAFLLYAVLLARDGSPSERTALQQQLGTTPLATVIANMVNGAEFNAQFTASGPAR